eukprot:TRINITY_DN19408_c0_g1_i1.p1 TRINITY_DN19408_c0_g1~~TRINITY_DN19408_c0_g1_i1.p1  ORF type:complete len:154 (+),score=61.67 TRINITY_DN19408_c0_g1_i1:121-582(+)
MCIRDRGITSQRLVDYDEKQRNMNDTLDTRLEEIRNDPDLKNSDKKKRMFTLKQKFSSTKIADAKVSTSADHNPVAKVMESTSARREEIALAKEHRERDKARAFKRRAVNNALLTQRTSRGQPVLANQVQFLLNKLEQEKWAEKAAAKKKKNE